MASKSREIELGDYVEEKPRRKLKIKKRSKDKADKPTVRKRTKPKSEETAKPRTATRQSKTKTKPRSNVRKGESLALVEEFKNQEQEILEKIPSVMENEIQQVKEYGQMFNTLSRMARIAEEKYLDTNQSKDMYAALKAYAEMREIIADMRAMADFSQYSEQIKKEMLEPLAQSSAAALIEYHKGVIGYLQTVLDPGQIRIIKDKLNNQAKEAGIKINEALVGSNSAADSMFSTGK